MMHPLGRFRRRSPSCMWRPCLYGFLSFILQDSEHSPSGMHGLTFESHLIGLTVQYHFDHKTLPNALF